MVKFYLNPRPKSKNSAFDPQKRKYYSNNIDINVKIKTDKNVKVKS